MLHLRLPPPESSAARRKILGNCSTASQRIPEKDGGFASADNPSRQHGRFRGSILDGAKQADINMGLAESMANPAVTAPILAAQNKLAISPDAIASAIDQPADVNVNEIVVQPTAQA